MLPLLNRLFLPVLSLSIILLFSETINAQGNHRKPKYQKYKPAAKFKRNKKTAIICPIFIPSEYPYQGIGIKIGDPFAITYKFYPTEFLGIEFVGGLAASGLYSKYHRSNFNNFEQFDTLSYEAHNVKSDITIQARIMYHSKVLDSKVRGLDVFIGAGWQFRSHEVIYEYLYQPDPNTDESGSQTISQFTSGPEIFAGLEYAYFDLPISAFVETGVFKNLDIENSKIKLQGGIGVRYIF